MLASGKQVVVLTCEDGSRVAYGFELTYRAVRLTAAQMAQLKLVQVDTAPGDDLRRAIDIVLGALVAVDRRAVPVGDDDTIIVRKPAYGANGEHSHL
jgi:hypothetical protein